jgi:pimeloyl-ACP methyl ester carboxylesterase
VRSLPRPRTLILAGAAVAVVLAAAVLLVVRPWADDGPATTPSATAERFVEANGHRLYLTCRGAGSPTVLLDAGLGDGQSAWDRVWSRARDLPVRVCAYDRAGVGGSDAADGAGSITAAAQDLHALLAAAGERPPYVLVSHSIAGLIHRYYTTVHGDEVAGLVMVDTAPDDWDLHNGLSVFTGGGEPLDVGEAAAALRRSDDLGDRPVVVIEAARTSEISQAPGFPAYWSAAQRHLAGLSTDSILVVADSNHGVPASQPELVVGAVHMVVAAVRDGTPLPACASSELGALNGQCAPAGG